MSVASLEQWRSWERTVPWESMWSLTAPRSVDGELRAPAPLGPHTHALSSPVCASSLVSQFAHTGPCPVQDVGCLAQRTAQKSQLFSLPKASPQGRM